MSQLQSNSSSGWHLTNETTLVKTMIEASIKWKNTGVKLCLKEKRQEFQLSYHCAEIQLQETCGNRDVSKH